MTKEKVYSNIDIGFLTPIFRFKFVIIFTNWLFQGLLYADKTEKAFKLFSDLALTILFFSLIPDPDIFDKLIVSFLISHTINWIFNGQIFALFKNFGIIYTEPHKLIQYANEIKDRAASNNSIDCVVVYGSLVRDEIKSTSDLDVRIIRKKGLVFGILACVFAAKERSRALFNCFPLDIYVLDSRQKLSKMREDESPLVLLGSLKKG